ncbi:hypothetical protein B0H66DRAFT_600727 [Apodospora peruviana]|uniref:Uncharacterized protein n=1 Tax=Apodospora peruviana TaxID=516989 RepID=A0AAE0IKU2_9PEZI|nr:hypothetical protein B0H66DRAFT_600727 [Apodospora peruviana]
MSNKRGGAVAVNNPSRAGGGSGGDTASSAKGYWDKMTEITKLCDELRKDNEGRQAYEQLQQEAQRKSQEAAQMKAQLERLRQQHEQRIEELEAEVEQAKEEAEVLQRRYDTKFLAWDKGAKQHEETSKELVKMKDELSKVREGFNAARREKKQLEGENSLAKERDADRQTEIEKLQREYKIIKLELEKKTSELEGCRKTLTQLKKDLGICHFDRKATEKALEELAVTLHELAWLTFNRDVPENVLLLSVSGTVLARIPQVASNSPAARAMRCALAEAVIAETLSAHIFQPDACLIGIPGGGELRGLVQAIEWLTKNHPMQATIVRCQLVKVCEEFDTESVAAARATNVVCEILKPWLGGDEEQFASELTARFSEAVRLWLKIQSTRTFANTITTLEDETWLVEEDARARYDDGEPQGDDPRASMMSEYFDPRPVAVLFPQICARKGLSEDQGGGGNLIYHGHALFPTQPAVIIAGKERSSQPNLRRNSVLSRRRASQTGSQEGQQHAEAQRPGRRLSISSHDGRQPKSLLGSLLGNASDSERGSVLSVRGRAIPTASVSSTGSRRSRNGVGNSG